MQVKMELWEVEDREAEIIPFVIEVSRTFEASVVQCAADDEELKQFANIYSFKTGRYFEKTAFHEAFVKAIKHHRQEMEDKGMWVYESGIKGLGKTSSILYYVLDCRKKSDTGIHYIDLCEVEKRDKNLDAFTKLSKNFQRNDCLIIDHITLYNSHHLQRIKEIVDSKMYKFILIETGITACAHRIIRFGKKYQLDEESFLNIWNGSLESSGWLDQGLERKGKEVYDLFSKRFIMTPRLLHQVLAEMKAYGGDNQVLNALMQYSLNRKLEITNFKECHTAANAVFSKFQLHTRILLHYIKDHGEYIFSEEQTRSIMIAINVFEMEYCQVHQEDLDTNVNIVELGLGEGDVYVKIRLLEPYLAKDWHNKLPFKPDLESGEDFDQILDIVFHSGGTKKELKKQLVEVQKTMETAVIPIRAVTTSYEPSQSKSDVRTTTDYKMVRIPAEHFFAPESLPDSYLKDIPADFKGHEKNIAMFAVYVKELLELHNAFFVYPKIPNCMGFDYFVYSSDFVQSTQPKKGDPPPPKRLKDGGSGVLYLVQVATGAFHRGDTIGQALDIVKFFLSDLNVIIHAVVITVKTDRTPYTLTKCCFENITVLNLYSDKNTDVLHTVMKSNHFLYKLYLQLVEMKRNF